MIYKKLLELQKKEISLSKDATNPFFKSKYLTLDKILQEYKPALSDLNIVIVHQTIDNKVITKLFDTEDESFINSEFMLVGSDPQKLGSCITYAKRYNLGQLLNIVTDEDDDGNKASQKKQFGTKEMKTLSGSKNPKELIAKMKLDYEFSEDRINKIKQFLEKK